MMVISPAFWLRNRHSRFPCSWRILLGRTFRASTTDRVSLAAAGCAFYATLALFPAISMLISGGGMVLDPTTAEQQLGVLSGLLPAPPPD
jgi:membrane protein